MREEVCDSREILISIIIPVYNAEKYLPFCIESIIGQTYKNIELILVNDGSQDTSGYICDQYAEKYSTIHVIHQKNAGQNAARKVGLNRSEGDYIIFVDADDWIDQKLCEKLYQVMSTGMGMIYYQQYRVENEKKYIVKAIPEGIYESRYIAEQSIDNERFFLLKNSLALYSIAFRKDIIQKALNNMDLKIDFSEDAACVLTALLEENQVYVSDYIGYYYRIHPDSFSHMHNKSNINSQKRLYKYLYYVFKRKLASNELFHSLKWLIIRDLLLGGYDSFISYPGIFPFKDVTRSNHIVLYGAGVFGQELYKFLKNQDIKIELWVDKRWNEYQKYGLPVRKIQEIVLCEYDYILVAVLNYRISDMIYADLLNMGAPMNKILCVSQEIVDSLYTNSLLEEFLQ